MSEIRVDTISEKTSANGVAIDSVTLKDGGVTTTTLTMDGLSTTVAAGDVSFFAKTDASQTVANNTYTKMTIAEGFDRGGNYASDKFTAPKAGVYHFVAAARLDGVAVNRFALALYKNGSSLDGNAVHLTSEKQMTNGSFTTVESHNFLSLSANDEIEVYVYHNVGSNAGVFQKGFFGYRVGTFN